MIGRKRVAWNLRRLRVERGLSQEALAVDAEIDRSYVGRLERAVENPTVGLLDKIVATLDADIGELFRLPRSGDATPKPLKGGRRKTTSKRTRKT